MKILLVDDERDCLNSLVIALNPLKHNIYVETNPLNVVNLCNHENFEIIITDIKMPGLNGVELLSRLKQINKNIIIILMTAYSNADLTDVELSKEILANDVYAFLRKPIDIKYLINLLKELET